MSQHANVTRFKKGCTPWNKKPPVQSVCQNCGIEFHIKLSRIKSAKYCSRKCCDEYRRKNSKYKDLIQLREEGRTIRELAEYHNVHPGTISRILVSKKHRLGEGNSESSLRVRLKKVHLKESGKCIICGYKRYLELVHIKAAKDGGLYNLQNTVLMCPNHHRLYDAKLLNKKESYIMEDYYESHSFKIPI